MNRRDVLQALCFLLATSRARAAAPSVSTLIGTGSPGLSDREVNNPYGLIIAPNGWLHFCDLDNQMIRRLDLATRSTAIVAGSGRRGYSGDGGPAVDASLNMPHEIQFDVRGNMYIAERDNHVVRKVDGTTGVITTLAGTGVAGFSGDGGPAARAELRSPHSVVYDTPDRLFICDIGNHRIRVVNLITATIDTYGGTGERKPIPEGAPLQGTALNGPRTMALASDGDIYLALREGNAIYRIDRRMSTLHHVAGTGEQGYTGDGGPARLARLAGPKGLAWAPGELFIADTESHVIRRVDLTSGVIATVLGDGQRGDGPEPDPLRCRLARPHGILVDRGSLFVADSETHRIRVVK